VDGTIQLLCCQSLPCHELSSSSLRMTLHVPRATSSVQLLTVVKMTVIRSRWVHFVPVDFDLETSVEAHSERSIQRFFRQVTRHSLLQLKLERRQGSSY
jgi:hypothetical protein